MPLIRLFLICQCCMFTHHDTHNQIWKKRYGFYTNKKLQSSLPVRPERNYTMTLCNDFRGNWLVLFWTMCNSVEGPCDIKSFKISTVYDIWFSRYRPSNMKLATHSALVLVFINFLWAVYGRRQIAKWSLAKRCTFGGFENYAGCSCFLVTSQSQTGCSAYVTG